MPNLRTLAAIRYGYGLPLAVDAPDTVAAILAALAEPDLAAQTWPILGLEGFLPIQRQLRLIKNEGRDSPEAAAKREVLLNGLGQTAHQALRNTFLRAVTSRDGFRERLVTFWADHFTVVAKKSSEIMLPYALVEDAIRPYLTGNFTDMLTAVTLHPAMLLYLDQSSSVGPHSRLGQKQAKGLNENLAREVIELHSLGVGAAYTQADVTDMAKLLTGVTVDPQEGTVFEPRRAEPGRKTVLGKTYQGAGLDVVRQALADLAQAEATAQHLARKLAVHFVSDSPDPGLVAAVAKAYTESGGNLMATYGALLGHPAAWGAATEKARQPFDFLIAALRALGVTGPQLAEMPFKHFQSFFLDTMAVMGQPFKRPSGPNGFAEEAEEWITPQGLARRITWAMQVPNRLVDVLPDPVDFAQTALAERASEALLWAAARAEDQRQGVGLVLASAEFNRR